MKILLQFILIFIAINLFGQLPNSVINKWAFIGDGILFFSENDKESFVEIMEQGNYSFIDLYTKGESKNKKYQDKIKIKDTTKAYTFEAEMKLYTNFGTKLDTVNFLKEKSKNNILYIVGKSSINGKRNGVSYNSNCDTVNLKSPLYLYDVAMFDALKKLKPIDKITKVDLAKFLKLLEKSFKSSCNACNDNFVTSIVNNIVIQMGYNPISSYNTKYSTVYKTSALYQINFLLTIQYKDLKLTYEKLLNKFYLNKQ